jgi:hypothetical protein
MTIIPLWAKALIVAGIVAGAWLAYGVWRADVRREGYDARTAEYEAADALATIARAADVRAIEIAQAARLRGVEEHHEQERKNVQANADRIAAGLVDGTVRLRSQWAGCETGRLSADAATAAQAAEQDRLRRESLQRVLGWVGELQIERDECVDGWAAVAAESGVRVMQGK